MRRGAIDSESQRPASHEVTRAFAPAIREPRYPVIATQNLRLRPFGLADIPPLVAIANEHHVADTALDLPCPFTAKYAQQWIRSHPAAWDVRESVHWAVSVLADDRFVGYTCLHNIDPEEGQAEITFWVGPGMERARYATEAVQAALAFAFTELQIDRVCAFHLTRNLLATRVLTRIGMRQEGPLDQQLCGSDRYENVIVRGISRSAWLASL